MPGCCDMLKSWDYFGRPIELTYERSTTFKTLPGACLSLLAFTFFFLFVASRIQMVILGQNWTMISHSTPLTQEQAQLGSDQFQNVSFLIEFVPQPAGKQVNY